MSDLATLNSSLITDFLQTRTCSLWFSILLLHSWVFSLQHKLLCVGSILYQLKLILHPFLDQYHRYLHFIINKRYLGTKLSNGCQLIWNINTTVINTLRWFVKLLYFYQHYFQMGSYFCQHYS